MDQSNDDTSSHETPPEEKEVEELPPSNDIQPESKEESASPSKGREQIGRVRGTGVFDVPDGRDPSTIATQEENDQNFVYEANSGECGHCGRPFNVGRPEAKCTACGTVMHQFCFDGHVIKHHKPRAVGARIVKRDGKLFAKIRK